MKTLPHLKEFTYAAILVAFPFIFSASKDSKAPEIEKVAEKKILVPMSSPQETLQIIRVTVDSLKKTTITATQVN